MTTLVHVLAAVTAVSLVSFAGILAISMKKKLLDRLLFVFVSFATGTLLGAAFMDLLPEAIGYGVRDIFVYPLLGMLSFFVIEKFIYWHHHHTEKKEAHAFTYLNLIGDGLHNFIDGVVIAASFLHSVPLGIATTTAVIFHEIPQEIGDFSLLVYGGFSRMKALFFNFLSALAAVLGGIIGFFFFSSFESFIPMLLAYTAGHFIYIASVDIIPELMEYRGAKASVMQFLSIVTGIMAIWYVITVFE